MLSVDSQAAKATRFVWFRVSIQKVQPTVQGRTVDDWIALLRDGNPQVRAQACVALAQLGPQARSAPDLIDRLDTLSRRP